MIFEISTLKRSKITSAPGRNENLLMQKIMASKELWNEKLSRLGRIGFFSKFII